MTLEFVIPGRTWNESNQRGHWTARAARAKRQRADAAMLGRSACAAGHLPPFPLAVKLTRVAPRELDDDGVVSATKAIRDGIADWLGVDDRAREWVRYEYGQLPGKYAVTVEIRSTGEPRPAGEPPRPPPPKQPRQRAPSPRAIEKHPPWLAKLFRHTAKQQRSTKPGRLAKTDQAGGGGAKTRA